MTLCMPNEIYWDIGYMEIKMRKVYGKSVVLGIGIGMIITATAGMIYSAGNQNKLSKEEIISLAKEYGLKEPVNLLIDDTSNSSNTAGDSTPTKSTTANTTAPATTSTDKTTANSTATAYDTAAGDNSDNNNDRNVVVEIKAGYKSQDIIDLLLEKKVISSKEDFSAVLASYKAETLMRTGSYKFKKNEDIDYIVKTICDIK